MRTHWISLIILLTLALSGCGASQAGGPESPDLPVTSPTQEPPSTLLPVVLTQGDTTQMNPSLPTRSAAGLEGLIAKAREDLAQRLSISPDQISLVEAAMAVWPDSSMGCPQPGMEYLQVPEDGALIILRAEGNLYEYHTGGRRGLFLCEKKYKSPSPPPQIDLTDLTPPAPDNSIPPGEDN